MSVNSSITRIDTTAHTAPKGTVGPTTGHKKPTLLHGVYGPYVLLPLLAGLTWFGGLLALIGVWAATGTPRYTEDSANIAFISNVGAYHQTLFICICVITAFFYISSLLAERWLRHVDRIPAHGKRNKRIVVYDILAIVFCILGSAALIVLSAFNCYSYPVVHWSGTAVFVVCVAISAVFQTCEILALKKDHPDRAHLMRNAVLKLTVVACAIATAVAFAALYGVSRGAGTGKSDGEGISSKRNRLRSAAAVLEWVVALELAVYFFTLVLDLWPASKTSPRYLRKLARVEGRALDRMGIDAGQVEAAFPMTGRERNGRVEGVPEHHTEGGEGFQTVSVPAQQQQHYHQQPYATNAGYPTDTNGQYVPAQHAQGYAAEPQAYPTTANPNGVNAIYPPLR